MNDVRCPLCGYIVSKVIYYGLPMKLCLNTQCMCLFGFWAWLAEFLPTNGEHFAFLAYEGSYWRALWFWLVGDAAEE